MSHGRRKRERRNIYARVPTKDGHMVAVRSHTVAQRLLAQQELLEAQVKELASVRQQVQHAEGDLFHARQFLDALTSQRLVRVLVWLRWIRVPAAAPVVAAPPGPVTAYPTPAAAPAEVQPS